MHDFLTFREFFYWSHVTTLQKLFNEHSYKNKPAVMAGSSAATYKLRIQNSIFVLILDIYTPQAE